LGQKKTSDTIGSKLKSINLIIVLYAPIGAIMISKSDCPESLPEYINLCIYPSLDVILQAGGEHITSQVGVIALQKKQPELLENAQYSR